MEGEEEGIVETAKNNKEEAAVKINSLKINPFHLSFHRLGLKWKVLPSQQQLILPKKVSQL